MANGASRLFEVFKETSKATNTIPSQMVSLTVKSVQPLIFTRDDRIEIPEEFCLFSKLIRKEDIQIGDIVTAMVFNEGQNYFIEHNNNDDLVIVSKNDLDNAINNAINKILETTNYKNEITNLHSALNFIDNSQQIIKNNDLITLNITFKTNSILSLTTNTSIFVLPEEIRPEKNVILFTRSDYNLGICYIRASTGEVVINFNANIQANKEINILGQYYINTEEE